MALNVSLFEHLVLDATLLHLKSFFKSLITEAPESHFQSQQLLQLLVVSTAITPNLREPFIWIISSSRPVCQAPK